MTAPLISIVIPSLNQRQYLEQAIESLLDQSYRNIEVIVMDGGSTDGSVEVLERLNPRLTSWQSQGDAGPADALNQGFARAKGDLLGFLNADDFLLPGALERIASAFQAWPSADVISGHGYFAKPSGELGAPAFSDRWDDTRFRYGACVLLQPATYFRRTVFERAGGFRRTGRVCWDMELWASLSAAGARFETLDAFLAVFRLHEASITGGNRDRGRRRDDAKAVQADVRGRPETLGDRLAAAYFRAEKFAKHPFRALKRRLFFFSALKRWSL